MSRLAWIAVALAGCAVEPELAETSSDLDISKFVLPQLADAERAAIVHKYDAIDPQDLVPRGLLEDALVYFDVNHALIPKTQFFAVVDFTKHSGKDRYWLVDTTTGAVEPHKVAHGDGSDPDNDGLATLFGNVDGSHKTSLGFYLTGEIYDGTHVHSMRLDGLSPDGSPNGMANTNARSRLIVMHEASYVSETSSQQGRSNGCLALDPASEVSMVDRIHDGSLIYASTQQLAAPVGRCTDPATCTPADDPGEPVDPADPNEMPAEDGGCSTGGGAQLGVALAIGALLRRRRR